MSDNWLELLRNAAPRGIELAELEMASPVFDQSPPFANSPSHKLIILSAPRSGSSFLCRRLWIDGIGKPMEYLNPLHLQSLRRRFNLPMKAKFWCDKPKNRLTTSLHAISRWRQANDWFSIKLQPIQLKPWLSRHEQPEKLVNETLSDWHVLPLLRKNWYQQLASLIISRATGSYDFGLAYTHADSMACQGSLMTPERIKKAKNELSRNTESILNWLDQHPGHHPLWMEEILEWDALTWQKLLPTYLPSLKNQGQETLIQGLGITPLIRRQDPFAQAKAEIQHELTKALKNEGSALPPSRLEKLINS